MEGDKTVSTTSSSGKNKQSREQRRRHLTKSASHDRIGMVDQPPLFGRPAVVDKKDSELYTRLHNVFGDYNNYKTAMKWEKQTSYFGVADATPSTPIQGSKYSPFDSEFRAASSRGAPSSSGTSSSNKHASRHQVAEPPTSSQQYVNKKDKSRTKLHPKHSSKADISSQLLQQQRPASGLATVAKSNNKGGEVKKLSTAEGSSGEISQATNVLKSKLKKEKVRPYKPQVTGQNTTTLSSSTSSSHSKNAPPTSSSSSSLFDFNAPTVGSGTSNNSLPIHRSSSNSSTTSTTSKPKQSMASERPSSISSTPSSRYGDSHVTPSHSNSTTTSHKHSKKLAPVLPTFGSSAGGKSQEVDSPRVVSIKRTSSLEFVKQTPSWDRGVAGETISPAVGETNKGESHNTGKTKGKKKEKKLHKKLKKDKMDHNPAEKKVDISNLPTSHTVVSTIGHVNTAESHMTTKPLVAHVKVEPTRSRPSDLKITTGLVATSTPAKTAAGESVSAGLGVDEESQDTGDIHSMLQEMMKPLNHSYSLVTPIPTPIKARPFVFPTSGLVSSISVLGSSEQDVFKKPPTSDASHVALPQGGATPSRKLSCSSSDDEWDTDSKMAVEMAVSALDMNLAEERPPPQRPASPALSVSSSSSSSAESSSDSSDSSSEGEGEEGEEEGEESESNITPTLEKLHRQTQLSGAAITPLKKTPPRVGLLSTSSLLTDESANLSPAKPLVRLSTSSIQSHSNDSMLVNQVSTGFNIAPTSQSQIDSSDSDSGSESDSESSDSEDDQSSGEEDNNNDTAAGRTENSGDIKRASIPLSDDLNAAPFGSSTGFFDDGYDFLGATSQFGEHQSKPPRQQEEEDEVMDTGSNNSNTVMTTATNSNSEKHSRMGKKRKHSSATSHFSLRKAQKLMSTVQFSSDAEDGEALSRNHNAPSALPLATVTGETAGKKKSISHLSVSEMNSGSEMYEDDEEEGEIPSDEEEQAKKPLSRQQSMETSSELPHQHAITGLSSRANQGGATSSGSRLESVKQEEEEGETNSLVVSFQLSSIPKLPMQKPKATVEPFFHNNTSTSKVARRRNTVDAPGERDGDEVQPRGMSRERGERSTYNRHRDEYGGRDYHRPPRSHRDNSARWDRDSSRDRRMYGSSEERSGRHGSGRHSGWDRDGDYHRSDDYWMDGGGTHYDRGARDYERGSRQPDRKRGAEYFMQEARRRKHEADKISIPGVDKAKAYMESVPFFMRHGDAIEHERQQQSQQWAESGGGALKRNPFKMYSDTLSVVRFCQNMAGDCKPLVVVCLRCQSILLWRMFQLKQTNASHVQKELQEFFVLPKGAQSKSPYPNNFSPLPSPASVSSTASNGSGGGAFPQDPSPSCNTSIPKHIYNKAAEHLTIASHVNQSFDTWRAADSMMEQCREFFAKAERKCGRIYQFSSNISQAANWVESMLRCLR